MNHYDEERTKHGYWPACGCGEDARLTNTSAYGWICDDCLAEYERVDAQLEEHAVKRRKELQKKREH